jgi:hypothetical protein
MGVLVASCSHDFETEATFTRTLNCLNLQSFGIYTHLHGCVGFLRISHLAIPPELG